MQFYSNFSSRGKPDSTSDNPIESHILYTRAGSDLVRRLVTYEHSLALLTKKRNFRLSLITIFGA